MNTQHFIPSKIKVGFQNRDDTYTKKLGYVIYYDLKGVLRKEKSWSSWRDEKIDPLDIDNVPTEGFVLNKDVGGARRSYGWNARVEKVRVYDPRDFEFEISIPNLLFILREGDCSRGKGLEGKFVYSWNGTELILLPVACQEYQNSVGFTKLQDQNIKIKDLIRGATYISKRQEKLIYLGKLDKHTVNGSNSWRPEPAVAPKHVFSTDNGSYLFLDNVKSIAALVSDAVVPDFAERIDAYLKSVHGSKISSLFLKKTKKKASGYRDLWAYEKPEKPGEYLLCSTNYTNQNPNEIHYVQIHSKVEFKNGQPAWESLYHTCYPDGSEYKRQNKHKFIDPTNLRLFAKMDSGAEFPLGQYDLIDPKDNEEDEDDGEEN